MSNIQNHNSQKSRVKLTQEEAEKRLYSVLEDTPYVLSEPFEYNGSRETTINLRCTLHNTLWTIGWTELCIRASRRERYCGCTQCKLTYTKESCELAAKKCKYRSEFAEKFKGEYFAALRNGWLDEICSHMITVGNRYNRCIYAFEFGIIDGIKYVYVGLTDHLEKRRQMHARKGTVYKFCQTHKIELPPIKQLTKYVSRDEAAVLEGEYLQKYIDKGWTPINIKKTGGLGGHTRFDGYTYEECKEAGLKYGTRSNWRIKDYSTYYIAKKFNWIDSILKPNERWSNNKGGYWTKEKIAERAKDFEYLRDFRNAEPAAYTIACRERWTDEVFAQLKHKSHKCNFSIEQIKAELDKYDTTTDFVKAEPSMYNWCSNHKIRLTEISDKPVKRIAHNKKVVYQYTLEGKLLRQYESAREAAKEGFDFKKISAVCLGKRKQHAGYIFSFSADGVTPVEVKPPKPKVIKVHRVIKGVRQYTLSGEFIREYASTREAAEITGIAPKAIQGNVSHKTHTASGYIFKYSDDDTDVKSRADLKSPKAIPVLQFELDGTFVQEWTSIKDAEKAMYKNGKGHISEVCKGKRASAVGYVWKYKE